jgi:pimeloyl-ACP methyl ester carboxylesterase
MIARWWWGPKVGGQVWPKDRHVPSFDGTQIRYTMLGPRDAPVVSLCAGFLCPDTYWTYIAPALAADHRVLVWNYRGVGVSELPRRPGFHALRLRNEDLTVEANARDLRAILDAEDVERTVVVGHSMGTQTALETYRQDPSRVTGLVSIAGAYTSPLRTFYGTDVGARLAPFGLPLLHAFPRVTLLAWRAALKAPIAFPLGRYVLRAIGPGADPKDMHGYFDHLSLSDPLVAAKMIRGMHSNSATDLLPKIDVPVLIAHGTADPFTPLSVARRMEEVIPDATLVAVEAGSHTLPIERPDLILEAMRPFLRRAFGSA